MNGFPSLVPAYQFYDAQTNEAVRDVVPEPIIWLLTHVTHLGDGAVLVVLGVTLYWFGAGDRRQRAFVLAIATASLAVAAGIKGIFAIPRPETAFTPLEYPGYSFPSAHALGAAAIYGTLAVVLNIWTKRTRILIAGIVIITVMLSRVVIGVHYVEDVIVGALLGTGLVLIGMYFNRNPYSVFTFALIISAVAFVIGSREFTTLAFGASIGGMVGWQYVRDQEFSSSGAAIAVSGILAIPLMLGFRGVELLLFSHWPTEIFMYAVLTAFVLAVPVWAKQVEDWTAVNRLQDSVFSRRQPNIPEMDD